MRRITLLLASFALVSTTSAFAQTDLSGIKSYLLGKTAALEEATAALQPIADRYYGMAKGAGFDYPQLWRTDQAEVAELIEAGRAAWTTASPLYERMEGIVAGTPSLAQFDVDMDAGSSAEEDPENAVSFDITLPDGRVLEKPGNLFGITESTLWGTDPAFTSGTQADLDRDGEIEFAEVLPDANVLKGGVELLAEMAAELDEAANVWTPSESDAFTALAVMVPTMSEYFASWRDSRFVAGERSTQRDFVAISRLADILGILSGLQVVHRNVSPLIQQVDAPQDEQIAHGLANLKAFVARIYQDERAGERFSAEEADTLGAEAQNRATAVTGQIVQVAGELAIPIQE